MAELDIGGGKNIDNDSKYIPIGICVNAPDPCVEVFLKGV
jgi:hypothetical protein